MLQTNAAIATDIDAYKALNADQFGQIASQQKTINKLTREVTVCRGIIASKDFRESSNSEVKILKEKISRMENNLSQLASLQSKCDENVHRVATLSSNAATLDSNIATLSSKVATLDSNIAALSSNAATLDSNIAALSSNAATLDSNIAALTSKVMSLEYINTKKLSNKILNTVAQIILFYVGGQPRSTSAAKSKFSAKNGAIVNGFISEFVSHADALIAAQNSIIHPSTARALHDLVAADLESVNCDPNIRQSKAPHIEFAINVLEIYASKIRPILDSR